MKNGLTQYKIFGIYYDNIFFKNKKISISNPSTLSFCVGGPKHQGGQSMDEGEGREQGGQDDHNEEELDGHGDNYYEDEGDGDDNMAMCNMGEGWYLVACYWDGHWARAVG